MPHDVGRKPTIDLVGTAPGYTLLLSELRRRVRGGEWQPGDQIPSERELCEEYGVSRTMVRQTLGIAEREGLLVKVPGRGTFVARPQIRQELSAMTTFRSTLAAHGLSSERRVLFSGWEVPPIELAERLHLPRNESVFYAELLGLADDEPIALYQSYTPPAVAEAAGLPKLIESGGLITRSVPELAGERLGLAHISLDQHYEAVALAESAADRLGVPSGAPAFRVSTVFSAPEQAALGATVVLYRGDRFTFQLARTVGLALEDSLTAGADLRSRAESR